MRRGKPFCNRRRMLRRTVLCCVVLVLLFAVLEACIHPRLVSIVTAESRAVAVSCINEATLACLEENPTLMENLYTMEYEPDGQLRTISVNPYTANLVQLQLTKAVSKRIDRLKTTQVKIPLGTLIGGQFLTGLGPRIPLRVSGESYVDSNITAGLVSVGVNQCRYQLDIHFTAVISALLGGYSTSISVESTMPLVQVMLTGQVPGTYIARQTGGNLT